MYQRLHVHVRVHVADLAFSECVPFMQTVIIKVKQMSKFLISCEEHTHTHIV